MDPFENWRHRRNALALALHAYYRKRDRRRGIILLSFAAFHLTCFIWILTGEASTTDPKEAVIASHILIALIFLQLIGDILIQALAAFGVQAFIRLSRHTGLKKWGKRAMYATCITGLTVILAFWILT